METTYIEMTIITRREKLNDLRETLLELGITGITVTMVEGFGQQIGEINYLKHGEQMTMLIPKVMISTIFTDIPIDLITSRVIDVLRTGIMGDGKIFYQEHKGQIIRIRTGEKNQEALS